MTSHTLKKITWNAKTTCNRLDKNNNEDLFGSNHFQVILHMEELGMWKTILKLISHNLAESGTPILLKKLY